MNTEREHAGVEPDKEPAGKLNHRRVRQRLHDTHLYRRFVWEGTVPSTNLLARELGEAGTPHATVVWAEYQTEGRGRQGRKWSAGAGKNLVFSILLRPLLSPDDIFQVTMALGLATCEAVAAITGLEAKIKWPNDLFLQEKKVGGILTECLFREGVSQYAVTGLGLNVNWEPSVEAGMPYPVTSLRKETGRSLSREELLAEILVRFESRWRMVGEEACTRLRKDWLSRCMLLGKKVSIRDERGGFEGIARDVRENGALLVEGLDGVVKEVFSGDVSVRFQR